tara:strand:+ start:650 stop:1060 length:411 start_codon:yes stop_codon:yes gene_type:complete
MAFEPKKINPIDLQPRVAVGVDLPFSGRAVFNSTFQTVDAIKANLINYLLTGRGERYFNPSFGSGLRNLLFENIGKETLVNVEIAVKEALKNYFPQLNILNLSLEDRTDENIIQLKLNFSIAGTKIEDELLINFEE